MVDDVHAGAYIADAHPCQALKSFVKETVNEEIEVGTRSTTVNQPICTRILVLINGAVVGACGCLRAKGCLVGCLVGRLVDDTFTELGRREETSLPQSYVQASTAVHRTVLQRATACGRGVQVASEEITIPFPFTSRYATQQIGGIFAIAVVVGFVLWLRRRRRQLVSKEPMAF